eukprot:Nk52_evm33s234 gene=Nk52_evmTU33s234
MAKEGTKSDEHRFEARGGSHTSSSPCSDELDEGPDMQKKKLDHLYDMVNELILAHQHAVTGLVPSCPLRPGDDKGEAWVRDTVYTSFSVWGLSIAYRKYTEVEDVTRAYELEKSVVKLMRGVLFSMMSQTEKVESFKQSQLPGDALHAKYAIETGETCVGDNEYGHLQIDATSLFVLTLAQITASGIQIVFTVDEVSFIQNLVFYIERAYRTPDYGMWERGDKSNHGNPELNASSIGMANAALEAINELDLFGNVGDFNSTIHVLPDEIRRNKTVLENLLPRESLSKEIDAGLLSIISFPAFAVESPKLIATTKSRILRKLLGKYGCKRFLRDGHMTVKEDKTRLHYDPAELKIFENIECEWPLFLVYLRLGAIFDGDWESADHYQLLLDPLLVDDESGKFKLVPQMYYVPEDKVQAEYSNPHSQERQVCGFLPYLWAQSMLVLSELLSEGFVAVGEMDPLNRRQAKALDAELVVQVSILAEDIKLQKTLAAAGISSQLKEEAEPVKIRPPSLLAKAYMDMGSSDKLGLTGRPSIDVGILSTCKIYRIKDEVCAFTPLFLDNHQFYLFADNELLADKLKSQLSFIKANWRMIGRPTIVLPLTNTMLDADLSAGRPVYKILMNFKTGYCNGVRVRLRNINQHLVTSCIEDLSFSSGMHLLSDSKELNKPTNYLRLDRQMSMLNVAVDSNTHSDVRGIVSRSRSRSTSVRDATSSDETRANYVVLPSQVNMENSVSISSLVAELGASENLQDQTDILHYLTVTIGIEFRLGLQGEERSSVRTLLEEVATKAVMLGMWSIVRHTAGLLDRRVDDLVESITDLLIRQKQISIGFIPNETVIRTPLSPEEMHRIIKQSFGDDVSSASLTQEILVYCAMVIRTRPELFAQVLRIRVGLIIKVMASELTVDRELRGEEDALSELMCLSPFEMKTLFFQILSGEEVRKMDDGPQLPGQISTRISYRKGKMDSLDDVQSLRSELEFAIKEERPQSSKTSSGQWMRRRRLDGALNRVPPRFYQQAWKVLERCHGFSTHGHLLPQHPTINEMTPGELKFALMIEAMLNCIPSPCLRQITVEAIIILSMAFELDRNFFWDDVIGLDYIVEQSMLLFQGDIDPQGDHSVVTEEARERFFDCAPGGTYGTILYISQTVLLLLKRKNPDSTCNVS